MIDLMVYIKQGVKGDEVWSLGVDELLEGDGASAEQREKLVREAVEAAHAREKLARERFPLDKLPPGGAVPPADLPGKAPPS
jgi:hypothetical protein